MGYKNIEAQRAYHREYMKGRRDLFKKLHLCTECGKKDAYTIAGRSRCEEHNKYQRMIKQGRSEQDRPS